LAIIQGTTDARGMIQILKLHATVTAHTKK